MKTIAVTLEIKRKNHFASQKLPLVDNVLVVIITEKYFIEYRFLECNSCSKNDTINISYDIIGVTSNF